MADDKRKDDSSSPAPDERDPTKDDRPLVPPVPGVHVEGWPPPW